MAGSNEENNGSADQSNNNSKLWMEAMMARMLATVNQEFKSLKADLERTVKERSRRSPYQSEAENHHKNSSRSNDSRMRRHDSEKRQPRFSQPLGGNNLKIPVFRGTDDPEEYLDWEEKIEFVFSCREYKQEHKLMLAPTEFKDYALIWWEKLVATKKRVGDLPVESWNQMKHLMRRRFVPSHYHRRNKRAQEGKVKHLQEQKREQELYEETKRQVQEAFNSVEARQKKNLATLHSNGTEATKEKPICVKKQSQIVNHLPLLMKPLEAKCDLSSNLFDFVSKKLTNLEPEQPSSIVSFPQVTQEESPAETPRSLPLISELEQPIQFVSEPAHIPPILGELQSCEKEKRPETCLSLACPAFKPREPPDLVHREIIVQPKSAQHLLLGAQISETYNLIHYWQTFLTGYSFKLYDLKFSTSSIMHLSCSMSAQKDTGTLEKHQPLEVGEELDTLAIKGKPPDLQELQPNQRRSKSRLNDVTRAKDVLVYHQERKPTSFFQFKDEPPDPTPLSLMAINSELIKILIQLSNSFPMLVSHVFGTVLLSSLHLENNEKKLGFLRNNFVNQNVACLPFYSVSMTVIMHLSFCKWAEVIAGVKEEPPDLEGLSTSVFEKTGIGVVLMEATTKRTTNLISNSEAAKKRPRRNTKREEDERFKPPDLDQHKQQDISVFIMIKEEPPDATNKPKPSSNRSRGKFHKRSSFNNIDLVPLLAGKTDLRTNPFQVGEDDVIMASLEHEDKQQHEPEENGTKEQLVAEEDHGIKDHLEPEETIEEEVEAAQKVVQEEARNEDKTVASLHQLVYTIQGKLECSYPSTLVVIQVTQVFIKRGVMDCTLFPFTWFCPNGFSK